MRHTAVPHSSQRPVGAAPGVVRTSGGAHTHLMSRFVLRIVDFIARNAMRFAVSFATTASIAMFFDYFAVEGTMYRQWWPVLLLVPLAYAWQYAYYAHQRRLQHQEFRRILSGEDLGRNRRLLLYLRPFLSEGALQLKTSFLDPIRQFAEPFHDDGVLDARLARYLGHQYLVARCDGAPKLTLFRTLWRFSKRFSPQPVIEYSDPKHWQDEVAKLAQCADLIVLIPPYSTVCDTAMEVNILLNGEFTDRVVFLMPNKKSKYKLKDGSKVYGRELWSMLLAVIDGRLDLPRYADQGGWVTLVEGAWTRVDYCSGSHWSRKSAIQQLLGEYTLTMPSLISAWRIATRFVLFFAPVIFIVALLGSGVLRVLLGDEALPHWLYQLLAIGIVLALLPWYFRYCRRFFLQPKRAAVLFASSLAGLAAGFWLLAAAIQTDLFTAMIEYWGLAGIELPTPGVDEPPAAYTMFSLGTILSLILISVYLLAFAVFTVHKYTANDQIDLSSVRPRR